MQPAKLAELKAGDTVCIIDHSMFDTGSHHEVVAHELSGKLALYVGASFVLLNADEEGNIRWCSKAPMTNVAVNGGER